MQSYTPHSRPNDFANGILIRITHRDPVTAVDLGNLLTALALDYRQFSGGGELAVRHIEQGSIIIFLQNAAVTAAVAAGAAAPILKGAKSVSEFCVLIRDIFQNGIKALKKRDRSISPGFKSVEAIVVLALHSGADFEIHCNLDTGEQIDLIINHSDALRFSGTQKTNIQILDKSNSDQTYTPKREKIEQPVFDYLVLYELSRRRDEHLSKYDLIEFLGHTKLNLGNNQAITTRLNKMKSRKFINWMGGKHNARIYITPEGQQWLNELCGDGPNSLTAASRKILTSIDLLSPDHKDSS